MCSARDPHPKSSARRPDLSRPERAAARGRFLHLRQRDVSAISGSAPCKRRARSTRGPTAAIPRLRRLIDVVPYGVPDVDFPGRHAPADSVLKGRHPAIRSTDFLLLWGGSILDWQDPQTLIRAVAISPANATTSSCSSWACGTPTRRSADAGSGGGRGSLASSACWTRRRLQRLGAVRRTRALSGRRRSRHQHAPRAPGDALCFQDPDAGLHLGRPSHRVHDGAIILRNASRPAASAWPCPRAIQPPSPWRSAVGGRPALRERCRANLGAMAPELRWSRVVEPLADFAARLISPPIAHRRCGAAGTPPQGYRFSKWIKQTTLQLGVSEGQLEQVKQLKPVERRWHFATGSRSSGRVAAFPGRSVTTAVEFRS